jgi:hypothetical protein
MLNKFGLDEPRAAERPSDGATSRGSSVWNTLCDLSIRQKVGSRSINGLPA